ncbi:hypothetical protein EVAR_81251_1 [Eumeta japonica]|uniref:Uncharacterized protein n=1 Tax=Eumeta variegata TaxID=151549 RepID=A0A4C1WSY4_EUMVA|nr:hypothetical protein EVAR_81251_1 [Eumeta japonica]
MATTEDNISAVRLKIETDKSDLPADLNKLRHRELRTLETGGARSPPLSMCGPGGVACVFVRVSSLDTAAI